MTPKEKSIQLFNKMVSEMPLQNNTNANVDYISKQCALIAVDEIIASNPIAFDENENCIAKQWWQEVKTEIEKL